MEDAMRRPRDFDAELKALDDKARDLRIRKVQQLGDLVIATGADALAPEELAGALLELAETTDTGKKEAWATRGTAMFCSTSRRSRKAPDRDAAGAASHPGGAAPTSGGKGAA
jgi:hypothetical protein